ncbi:hypothetical protein [Sutcliffiella deserti]|uniref:hypothetical protein n=1 Tax=Sutcliffiella deserti TaxID=2875501 RepID=UPI001CBBA046|nr:hypothetical protein [Sutcliffiella deserti]
MGIFFENASKQSKRQQKLSTGILLVVALQGVNSLFLSYKWLDTLVIVTLFLLIIFLIIEVNKSREKEG